MSLQLIHDRAQGRGDHAFVGGHREPLVRDVVLVGVGRAEVEVVALECRHLRALEGAPEGGEVAGRQRARRGPRLAVAHDGGDTQRVDRNPVVRAGDASVAEEHDQRSGDRSVIVRAVVVNGAAAATGRQHRQDQDHEKSANGGRRRIVPARIAR